jgi:hypothetical protein
VQVARALGLDLLLLCSTDDEKVRAFWGACGFEYTRDADIERWRVCHGDLIYMTNTVQMHKRLAPKRKFSAVEIVHGAFVHRMYAPLDTPPGWALQQLAESEEAKARKRQAATKSVSKGAPAAAPSAGKSMAPDRAASATPSVAAE